MTTETTALQGFAADHTPHVVEEWDTELRSVDPLGFPGYSVPLSRDESVRTALISLDGAEAVWIDCDAARQTGTMGAVAGERIVRAFDRAAERRLPVAQTVATGGARLQEGMISLLQMARTSSAAARHAAAGLLTAAVLRSPTTGGVYASWASLADLRAAVPGATIGFGGPRVVAEVTGEFPPPTSHTAESAYRHGLVDALIPESEGWAWLAAAIGARPGASLTLPSGRPRRPDLSPVPSDPYELLRRSRSKDRPSGLEWASWLTDSWVELRGADPAVRAGIATIGGSRVVVVAMDRYAETVRPGHPGPGAFRLAQRAVRLAGRLGLPVVTFVDTPGADPSPESEAAGLAGEIARTLLAMAELAPVSVSLCVGEGGSGGAIALAHTDRMLLLEGSVFSVIGPEAGATILYRDARRAPELTRALRMTPTELIRLGIVDSVVPESVPAVRTALLDALASAVPGDRDRRTDSVTVDALRPE
ncbi:carboxyl transferase domain-containing protein [Streptomyces sp. NPDC020792]|uniref:carboxyl transferase domain-containing protein n=1 Tax=Streptomyces sp. NPDC020792 TaxID=3365089 RepID=UPI00379400E7